MKRIDFYVALLVIVVILCGHLWLQYRATKWQYTQIEGAPCRINQGSGQLQVWSRNGWRTLPTNPDSSELLSPQENAHVKAELDALMGQDAATKGKVWIDYQTNQYYLPGSTQYGTTKDGDFISKDDADGLGIKIARINHVDIHDRKKVRPPNGDAPGVR